MADEKKPRKPRGPNKSKVAKPESNIKAIVDAVEFVSVATKNIGSATQTNICFHNGYVYAFDTMMAAGCPAVGSDGITAAADGKLLRQALGACKDSVSIVADGELLRIKSGSFSAAVPCVPLDTIAYRDPDVNFHPIDGRIADGFRAIGHIVDETAQRAMCATLLLQSDTMKATNGTVLAEYYHGINFADAQMLLPKSFIDAVMKSQHNIVGFGWTKDNSVTFWFENGAWIKTQMLVEGWVDTSFIMTKNGTDAAPLPTEFFDGINAVKAFAATGGIVYLWPGIISTHTEPTEGATYEMPTLEGECVLTLANLKLIEGRVHSADFDNDNPRAAFFFNKELTLRFACSKVNVGNSEKMPPVDPRSETPNPLPPPMTEEDREIYAAHADANGLGLAPGDGEPIDEDIPF